MLLDQHFEVQQLRVAVLIRHNLMLKVN